MRDINGNSIALSIQRPSPRRAVLTIGTMTIPLRILADEDREPDSVEARRG